MLIVRSKLQGVVIFKPNVSLDERGFFLESFRSSTLEKISPRTVFIQDNHTKSNKAGVLRGMHFQKPPYTQSKLVWVTRGAIFDVVIDLRKGSPTFKRWEGFSLSASNFLRLFVPKGFAHGYMTLEPETETQYKVDAYYNPEAEGGLLWNDPDLGVRWPEITPLLSEKDKKLPRLREVESPF
ncbi:MAG: dTDP-4-dehydrorhamnose 3,5-epimerase [Deltaproteobacteria bacterium]|jgi:dTDP-4-dehydrorhamnose 3,5-epimerase|nr:dTDP-4-dehydrorhamnose 3,5-epimerase [Deltaproteobacteria bacterium]